MKDLITKIICVILLLAILFFIIGGIIVNIQAAIKNLHNFKVLFFVASAYWNMIVIYFVLRIMLGRTE